MDTALVHFWTLPLSTYGHCLCPFLDTTFVHLWTLPLSENRRLPGYVCGQRPRTYVAYRTLDLYILGYFAGIFTNIIMYHVRFVTSIICRVDSLLAMPMLMEESTKETHTAVHSVVSPSRNLCRHGPVMLAGRLPCHPSLLLWPGVSLPPSYPIPIPRLAVPPSSYAQLIATTGAPSERHNR